MLATAASALLVAKVLSTKAESVLRDHELVDLGDEAELRAWEMIDQIEGLRDDINSIANSELFRTSFEAGKSPEELLVLARGLCKRYWKNHLRVEIVSFGDDKSESVILSERARLNSEDPWLPSPEAGPRVRISPIQRTRLERLDLPGGEPAQRWAPVVWAMTFLGEKDGVPAYVRIMTATPPVVSPRHFLVLEDSEGNQLIRYDEEERGSENDQIFLSLHEDEQLHDALFRARERTANPQPDEVEPKVERLARQEEIDLNQPYYFQEALPKEQFAKALGTEDPNELSDFSEKLRTNLHAAGTFGGISTQGGEIRLLAYSQQRLDDLQEGLTNALTERYGDNFHELD